MAGHASNWIKVRSGPRKGATIYVSKATRERLGMRTPEDARTAIEAGSRIGNQMVDESVWTRPAGAAAQRRAEMGDVVRSRVTGLPVGEVTRVRGALATVRREDGRYEVVSRDTGMRATTSTDSFANQGGATRALNTASDPGDEGFTRERALLRRTQDRERISQQARQQRLREIRAGIRKQTRAMQAELRQLPPTTRDPKVRAAQRKMQNVNVRLSGDTLAASKAFGKRLSARDFAGLVGAMDGAAISVTFANARSFTVDVQHPHYMSTRTITRGDDGELTISNDYFKVKPSAPSGVASRIVARQMEQAAALGVTSVELLAAGSKNDSEYNGYYTWPRLGYNNKRPDALDRYRDRMPEQYRDARDLHDLFSRPGGSDWWKDNGGMVRVEFDPRPGSPHRQHLAAYLKRKGISDPYQDV